MPLCGAERVLRSKRSGFEGASIRHTISGARRYCRLTSGGTRTFERGVPSPTSTLPYAVPRSVVSPVAVEFPRKSVCLKTPHLRQSPPPHPRPPPLPSSTTYDIFCPPSAPEQIDAQRHRHAPSRPTSTLPRLPILPLVPPPPRRPRPRSRSRLYRPPRRPLREVSSRPSGYTRSWGTSFVLNFSRRSYHKQPDGGEGLGR